MQIFLSKLLDPRHFIKQATSNEHFVAIFHWPKYLIKQKVTSFESIVLDYSRYDNCE